MSKLKICRDLNKLHPCVKAQALAVLEECDKEGLRVAVFETLRTLPRQKFLKAKGRSKTLLSYHRLGLAFDIVFLNKGKFSWANWHDWDKLAEIAEEAGLSSGWRWKRFKDGPHMELRLPGIQTRTLYASLKEFNNDYQKFYKLIDSLILSTGKLTQLMWEGATPAVLVIKKKKPVPLKPVVEKPTFLGFLVEIMKKLFTNPKK